MTQYIMAHRGASGYAPENTLEAFELASSMGAYGVELDVHLTRDNEIVVAHDETIDRVSDGSGFIKDFTLAELKRHRFNKTFPSCKTATVPTLKEVFELLGPKNLRINIELKNSRIDYEGLEQKVIDLAEKCDVLDKILFSSFNHHSMLKVKKINSSLYCGLLYEATMVNSWAYAEALHMNALHPHFSECLSVKDEISNAHALGIDVNPWTINSEEDLKAVISSGADHIITNYPDRALRILNASRRRT